MGAFLFMYHSITFWYPTLLAQMHRPTLPFLAALEHGRRSLGGDQRAAGSPRTRSAGAARRRSRRSSASRRCRCIVFTPSARSLLAGALAIGLFGAGDWGIVPGYLTERFPTAARAVGAGFAYHVGAGLGSFTPTLIGMLQDRGIALPHAMAACIAAPACW